MATKHKMTAYCPFGLQPDSLEVLIEYTYTPGSRATRIDPADPAEVDLISAKLVHHQISDMMQIMLEEWAGEYLTADGYVRRQHQRPRGCRRLSPPCRPR
jgi:hypothetical protein